jgi:hypothetical protein
MINVSNKDVHDQSCLKDHEYFLQFLMHLGELFLIRRQALHVPKYRAGPYQDPITPARGLDVGAKTLLDRSLDIL